MADFLVALCERVQVVAVGVIAAGVNIAGECSGGSCGSEVIWERIFGGWEVF